jgi:hypothetical protein
MEGKTVREIPQSRGAHNKGLIGQVNKKAANVSKIYLTEKLRKFPVTFTF